MRQKHDSKTLNLGRLQIEQSWLDHLDLTKAPSDQPNLRDKKVTNRKFLKQARALIRVSQIQTEWGKPSHARSLPSVTIETIKAVLRNCQSNSSFKKRK